MTKRRQSPAFAVVAPSIKASALSRDTNPFDRGTGDFSGLWFCPFPQQESFALPAQGSRVQSFGGNFGPTIHRFDLSIMIAVSNSPAFRGGRALIQPLDGLISITALPELPRMRTSCAISSS